jgi:hypothetical protein
METAQQQGKTLGLASIAMTVVSLAGVVFFSLIFISAPVGIVCGVLAIRKGHKSLGIIGTVLNSILLIGLVVFMIAVTSSKSD